MDNTEYLRPSEMNELFKVIGEYKDRVTVIAGGTNLIPLMRSGEKSPELLIDLSDIRDLSCIKEENGSI